MQEFQIASQPRDGVLVVTIAGDLDIVTSRDLDEVLREGLRSHDRIVLDLSAVDFMDTSSLAVIVGYWKNLVAAGGSLALAGARYQYTKTLWITGLAERIPMYESTDLAMAALTGAAPGAAPPVAD